MKTTMKMEFIGLLDESSKMVFLRNISYENAKNGEGLYEYLYDIIDDNILEKIQLNNILNHHYNKFLLHLINYINFLN